MEDVQKPNSGPTATTAAMAATAAEVAGVEREDKPTESPLAEVLRLFGHRRRTFQVPLITGNLLTFRVLATAEDMKAHREARSEWVTQRAKGPGHPRYAPYYPVSPDTLAAIFNLRATVVEGGGDFETLLWELAQGPNANGALFESIANAWVEGQFMAVQSFEEEATEHLKKDSETTL
jgi:hypothetical protein